MSDVLSIPVLGRIFNIQRFSIHDGPGIRTTVFMKGCPLKCIWCHNPEGISPSAAISFVAHLCIGCGHCFEICQHQAHKIKQNRHTLDREHCVACGACADSCHANALEWMGCDLTPQEVIDTVLRDLPFYDASGGGLTLSGGEPLSQFDFTEAVLRLAKSKNLNCCVETSGYAPFRLLERILPFVDLFLYDLKETDPRRHVEFTGVEINTILDNLHALHSHGASIRLRCPIIPEYNDRPDHFRAIANILQKLPGIECVEIMPYNRLGEGKLDRFGFGSNGRAQSEPPGKETIMNWVSTLKGYGVNVRHGIR